MELLELNCKIRDYFHQYKFKELTPGLFLKSNTLQSPNLFFFIAQSIKQDKCKAITIDAVVNKTKYILGTSATSCIEQHLAGIVKGEGYHPVDLIKNLMNNINKSGYWETKEKTIENQILGVKLYGWDIYLDGYKMGFTGFIERFAGQKNENSIFFDLNLNMPQQAIHQQEKMPVTGEFGEYLYKDCSKKLLFHLFDNYLDETIYCLSRDLGKVGFIFLMQCYFIYQLLILRGNISKTKKIGYDKKIASLTQKCLQGNTTGGVPLS
ncbi:glycine--tRNA ligase subunit alpha [Alkalicella caledoniensis]|uniref:Glycine--tRNA ligase subunit alpha n=1 Tax=Alkalicella caledoniensis TaxID=2731377 RepID=A0A7G9W4D6_ALKCA|nr:glycine--tRNA ligase subunit alpha [Alkalicella caledoniensis]QNO13548.1 glycine--tRNA ligase subunit alpha [Alkalicella caledoniensis]